MSTKSDVVPLPPASANVKPLNYREQFQGREVVSRFIDPCEAASKATMAWNARTLGLSKGKTIVEMEDRLPERLLFF
ncbi:uncharacterized protein C8R40DRAFT_1166554 [Lentinula edodes]|uniref:uncharacterized protein n=1 Tax=Lentinula edodes TaxID=5353 RepID=UPI001E8E124C|nr:uncharacterized protein C8R40DRAFT_1166554 [Lentinula edodes]KAH7879312.1 hypothetical protein C8R40DRAFT_1166554 [Lentinula edodes]